MRFYAGILAGAIVMFFWGFFYWTVLPAKWGVIGSLSDEDAVVRILKNDGITPGKYMIPGMPAGVEGKSPDEQKKAREAAEKRFETGPMVWISYQSGGVNQKERLLNGFLHMILTCALAAVLTRSVVSWASFRARWFFVAALGLLASIWIDLAAPIWFVYPWSFQLYLAGYNVGAFALGGLPLAWGTQGEVQVNT